MKHLFAVICILIMAFPINYSAQLGQIKSIGGNGTILDQVQSSNPVWIAVIGTDNNLWLVRSDGNDKRQVTRDASQRLTYSVPKWSPNGDLVAFIKSDWDKSDPRIGGSRKDLLLLNINNLSVKLLVEIIGGGFDWSPDSSKIIYDRPFVVKLNAGPNSPLEEYDGLWVVTVQSGDSNLLVPPPQGTALMNPFWDPKGRFLVFTKETGSLTPRFGFIELSSPEEIFTTEDVKAAGGNCDWEPNSQTGRMLCA